VSWKKTAEEMLSMMGFEREERRCVAEGGAEDARVFSRHTRGRFHHGNPDKEGSSETPDCFGGIGRNFGEAAEAMKNRFGHHLAFHAESLAKTRRGILDPCAFLEGTFKVEVKETDEGYLAEAALPGVEREAVSLERLPGMLVIKIRKEDEVRERPLFLARCDEEKTSAKYRDGVLEISIPKTRGHEIVIE
jgi:HSP20 family molecular chaperone IbpA